MQRVRSLARMLTASTVVAAVVLHSFIDHAVPVQTAARPLLVGTIAAFLLAYGLSRVVGPARGSIIATLLIVMLGIHGPGPVVVMAAVLGAVALILASWAVQVPWERIASGITTIALLLLLVASFRILAAGGRIARDLEPLPAAEAFPAEGPDIYLVLLDAYPRADTLKSLFEFDNHVFLDQLSQMGFDIYDESYSNYPSTTLSVASTLRGEHLEGVSLTQPNLRYLTWGSPIVSVTRNHGYKFVAVSPGWDELAIRRADRFVDTGGITQFEQSLLIQNAYGWLISTVAPEFFGDQRRGRVEGVLDSISRMPSEPAGPARLIWAHVPSPHYPLLFGPSGPAHVTLSNFAGYGHHSADAYVANIRALNRKVLEAITPVVGTGAVVILWSDHGSLTYLGPPEEQVHNFIAALTPGHPRLLGRTPSPVQILPKVLNAYLGTGIDVPSGKSFVFADDDRQELVPITP